MPDLFGCIPPRPQRHDKALAPLVVKALLPDVLAWLGEDDRPDEVRANLMDALADCHAWDGYKLAASLASSHHWEPDAALVDILDHASSLLWAEHDQRLRRWVQEHGVKCRRVIGAPAPVTSKGKSYTGTIVRVDADRAQYTVRVPELGHVESGMGTRGLLVDAEAVDLEAEESQ